MRVVSRKVVDRSRAEPSTALPGVMGWLGLAARSRRSLVALASLVATLCVSASCGAPVRHERYVHRGLPYASAWCRESDIPTAPPTSPIMTIWEVSDYPPETLPTSEQRVAAEDLVARTFESAKRNGWFDYDKGVADGYVKVDRLHHRKNEYMVDDAVLDPERPEMLMYYPRPGSKPALAGVMYYARTRTAPGPQVGGRLTVWHYHRWKQAQCIVQSIIPVGWAKGGECERGEKTHRSGEMMHVWLIDHPSGPFATAMVLPPDVVARVFAKRLVEKGI